jgi:plastocyanin
MKKWLALMLACLALGLVAAGCGGDDDDSGGDGGGGASTQEPAETGEGGGSDEGGGATAEEGGPSAGPTVGMKNIQFQPADITVKPGDTITFRNDEAVPHDVKKTKGPGPDFESGPQGGMSEGDTFKLTLDQPGTYDYVCRVHAPGMAGTITVK